MAAKRKKAVPPKVANRRGRQIIAYVEEGLKEEFAALAESNDRTLTAELMRALRYWISVKGSPPSES